MNPSVVSRPRPQPIPHAKRRDELLYIALALALLGLVTLVSPTLELPPVIPELTVENSHQWNVSVTITDADREASLAVGALGRETTQTFLKIIDQGERWIFSFRYGGIDGGELVLSRTELEEAGWQITVPEEFAIRMRTAGFSPSF
ncbi:MAG TPA: hypothetical protein VGR26_12160 [Acidimicrobiales bacterium]|nr:hypothetical protein [Acidimicrobiales bacterium]